MQKCPYGMAGTLLAPKLVRVLWKSGVEKEDMGEQEANCQKTLRENCRSVKAVSGRCVCGDARFSPLRQVGQRDR